MRSARFKSNAPRPRSRLRRTTTLSRQLGRGSFAIRGQSWERGGASSRTHTRYPAGIFSLASLPDVRHFAAFLENKIARARRSPLPQRNGRPLAVRELDAGRLAAKLGNSDNAFARRAPRLSRSFSSVLRRRPLNRPFCDVPGTVPLRKKSARKRSSTEGVGCAGAATPRAIS